MNTGELFVWLRRQSGFIRKLIPRPLRHKIAGFGRFIPSPAAYPHDDSYLLTRDHTTFKINRSDYVQWRLFYGVRDNALKEATRLIANDSIVLDIGANFGAFSLRLASHAWRNGLNAMIHSFEPNAHVRELFRLNVELNPGLSAFVNLHPFGLGAATEQRKFTIPPGNTGAARIVSAGNEVTPVVDIRALDDMSTEFNGKKIVFIKLIAGGFEGEILKGAWRTIETHRPAIFFEVTAKWYSEHGTSLESITARLTLLGYRLFAEYRNEMGSFDPGFFSKVDQYYILARPGSV